MQGFVIWGAGRRGREIAAFLGYDRVAAFIDHDDRLSDTLYMGKPIVTFRDYNEKYGTYPVIVSTLQHEGIVEVLEQNNRFAYFVLSECPAEMFGFGSKNIFEDITVEYGINEQIIVYGITLYSLLFYEFLKKKGCGYVVLIAPDEKEHSILEAYKESFQDIRIEKWSETDGQADRVFVTEEEDTEILKRKFTGNTVIENVYDLSDRIEKYHNQEIKRFKRMYDGKRCFIVATGPSLRTEDLDCLWKNREICISMNRIYCAFGRTKWRPDFYMVEDKEVLEAYYEEICSLGIEHKFMADTIAKTYNENKADKVYRYHLTVEPYVLKGRYPGFSADVSDKIYHGYTVTYSCLQLAAYLGFKEVYLLGVDFNYTSDPAAPGNHFVPDYFNNLGRANPANYEGMHKAYEKAKIYASEHDIRIFNATRGGKLDVFERVAFDSLFT